MNPDNLLNESVRDARQAQRLLKLRNRIVRAMEALDAARANYDHACDSLKARADQTWERVCRNEGWDPDHDSNDID